MTMRFLMLAVLVLALTEQLFARTPVLETPVQLIPLATPLDQDIAEYSSMTWCGDRLILIPQYPKRLAKQFTTSNSSYFYALAKQDILDFLDGKTNRPLTAEPIEVRENSLRSRTLVFDGYEGAACDGDTLWLTIESVGILRNYRSYLVPANIRVKKGKTTIRIDAKRIIKLGSQSGLVNKGDEAVTVWRNSVITFHEVNSQQRIDRPVAQQFDKLSGRRSEIAFPNLPFRLTDVTSVDANNRFWGINYRYSSDDFSDRSVDPVGEQYPIGNSHQGSDNVERLIEFEIKNSKVLMVKQSPIQLLMLSSVGRNWEALARLDNRGLLIATDKHPTSLFGFVPFR